MLDVVVEPVVALPWFVGPLSVSAAFVDSLPAIIFWSILLGGIVVLAYNSIVVGAGSGIAVRSCATRPQDVARSCYKHGR